MRTRIFGLATILLAMSCGQVPQVSGGGGSDGEKKPATTTTKPPPGQPGSIDSRINPPTNVPVQDPTGFFTNGTGGRSGVIEETFTSSNRKTSTYKASVPTDIGPQRAYGLLVYLHGDGGGDYKWFFEDNAKIAAQHQLMGVTVLSPNRGSAWYNNGEAHALFLHELLQNEIYRKYNIDKRRIYFAGCSGGSQFLTGQFVPVYGLNYRGGSVQMCGGGTNWGDTFNSSPEFLQNFRLYFYTQTADFLFDQVEEAVKYYTGKGMIVKNTFPQGGKHCGFDLDKVLSQALPQIMQ